MKHNRILRCAAAFALALALLNGCGGAETGGNAPIPDNNNAPVQNAQPVREEPTPPVPEKTETPPEAPEETPEPPAAPAVSEPEPAPASPETPAPSESAPEPPPPAPVDEPSAAPADGTYTASVALEGGTGRASVESPAKLRCENGQFWATIVWSSPNFDYMKVDGVQYDLLNTEGNSVFEIPVAAFDQKLNVIADTIAMSEPHEVSYTLTFDSASLQAA